MLKYIYILVVITITIIEINNLLKNYTITNGAVYQKENNQEVQDEEIILKVKTARLIYNEARTSYQETIKQFGKTSKDLEWFIKQTMEKFSLNGEINAFGINKLINGLLASNGHYEETMSGSDLKISKFAIFIEPKKDYGIAYLKLKFREKNLDISNFKLTQDLSKLQHDGYSNVIINFNLTPYKKKTVDIHDLQGDKKREYATKELEKAKQKNNAEMIKYWESTIKHLDNIKTVSHPMSDILNELEVQKKAAQSLGDDVGVNYYESNIKNIISEHPLEVSPEEWDNYTLEQKEQFIIIKMKEAKILGDKDSFNYWYDNLEMLKNRNEEETLKR